jgi:hypothetical protein
VLASWVDATGAGTPPIKTIKLAAPWPGLLALGADPVAGFATSRPIPIARMLETCPGVRVPESTERIAGAKLLRLISKGALAALGQGLILGSFAALLR